MAASSNKAVLLQALHHFNDLRSREKYVELYADPKIRPLRITPSHPTSTRLAGNGATSLQSQGASINPPTNSRRVASGARRAPVTRGRRWFAIWA
jgi:hypothetical protein